MPTQSASEVAGWAWRWCRQSSMGGASWALAWSVVSEWGEVVGVVSLWCSGAASASLKRKNTEYISD